jgi:hypothetical protein
VFRLAEPRARLLQPEVRAQLLQPEVLAQSLQLEVLPQLLQPEPARPSERLQFFLLPLPLLFSQRPLGSYFS